MNTTPITVRPLVFNPPRPGYDPMKGLAPRVRAILIQRRKKAIRKKAKPFYMRKSFWLKCEIFSLSLMSAGLSLMIVKTTIETFFNA